MMALRRGRYVTAMPMATKTRIHTTDPPTRVAVTQVDRLGTWATNVSDQGNRCGEASKTDTVDQRDQIVPAGLRHATLGMTRSEAVTGRGVFVQVAPPTPGNTVSTPNLSQPCALSPRSCGDFARRAGSGSAASSPPFGSGRLRLPAITVIPRSPSFHVARLGSPYVQQRLTAPQAKEQPTPRHTPTGRTWFPTR